MRALRCDQIVKITTRGVRTGRPFTRYGEVHHVEDLGDGFVLVQFTRQMKRHPEYGWVGLRRSFIATAGLTIAVEVVA